ncbi:hypothetical protein DY000_02012656 [Brassica cretica]|uniref:Uncharacterized protein n=1 Tax=Brassica cretica TaxID=69181 RepID=A0ABQ7CUC3_BRACR|nr:hypothetical protein DY000_02012656 [Brassica cretica]
MEDMDFGQTSIDEEIGISIDRARAISIDKSTEISVDNAHQTSIDNAPPEACKYYLTNDSNEIVVLGKSKGQLSNANNQITSEQGTEIPVQIKSISERDNEWKLPLQDYLNHGRTYSNSTINPEEARRLIKNIATSRSNEMMDIELGRKADPDDESPLLEIKEHLDSPHPALEGHNQFGIYQIDDDTLSELEKQIDFVDSHTLENNYPNPDSFTQNYDATVGSRQGRVKSRLNQVFRGNRKLATELNRKIDIVFTNPKRQVHAVLLRSGKRLIPRANETNNTEKHDVVEETSKSRSPPINLDDPSTESGTPRGREKPNTEEVAIELEEEEG